jgi:hypothetical protein
MNKVKKNNIFAIKLFVLPLYGVFKMLTVLLSAAKVNVVVVISSSAFQCFQPFAVSILHGRAPQ